MREHPFHTFCCPVPCRDSGLLAKHSAARRFIPDLFLIGDQLDNSVLKLLPAALNLLKVWFHLGEHPSMQKAELLHRVLSVVAPVEVKREKYHK